MQFHGETRVPRRVCALCPSPIASACGEFVSRLRGDRCMKCLHEEPCHLVGKQEDA